MKYYIVGAGGFGREVRAWVMQTPKFASSYSFGGFLDENPEATARFGTHLPVVGSPATHVPEPDAVYFMGIGNPSVRLRIGRELMARGANFPVLYHPAAIVGADCSVGTGSILCPGVVLTANVVIGEFVLLNLYATVGHDACIGDGATVSCHADVTGYAEVGSCAFLSSHASVIPSAKVGERAVVGAGSVVLRSVKPGATVVGVPAKQISP